MAIRVNYWSNENGILQQQTYVATNTWSVHGVELMRHEHYAEIARRAKIQLSIVRPDIIPEDGKPELVSYMVAGLDISGLMVYSVGSASPGNVKGQGAFLPEMAFKRAFDSWVSIAVRMQDN